MSETNPDIRQIRQLFDELADLSPDERQLRLQQIDAASPAIGVAVRKFLAADEAAGSFLGSRPSAPETPRQIGPYKLLQQIGEGGFGEVYMAEQTEPVRRRVALKIIKPGMDSRQVIARFEAERQALAMMDHPNIARVFDAGANPEGRPFFVMELVNGMAITQFCDENNLSIRQRMELLVPVCRAVHHAHQKGVIHRDIKPSNVLVTLHDRTPVPKVIDFGIAKALDQPLTDKTLFTEFKTMIGTPEYMSPEQAEISGLDIDTRSDVYSLGVLMYELLVGVTPFDGRELRSKAYGEMQRIIREVDPPSPSARLSTVATAAEVARTRQHSTADRLSGSVSGELDWIVMRCLEKDRTRRYDSAAALASDLEAYLKGDAVLASPPSTLYRLRKTLRRHRTLATTTLLVFIALMIGLVTAVAALREAKLQKRLADDRAIEAQREAHRAKTVSEFLEQTIAFADPYAGSGDPRISQVFDQAVSQIDAGKLGGDPQTEATLRTIIGRVSMRIDRSREGIEQLEKALSTRRAQQPADPADVAKVLNLLGNAHSNLADYPAADAHFAEAEKLASGLNSPVLLREIRFNQATSWMSRRRYDLARPALEELVAQTTEQGEELALYLEALASTELQLQNAPSAVELARRAVDLRSRIDVTPGRKYPNNRAMVESLGVLAQALGAQGKDAEAIALLEEAITSLRDTGRAGIGTLAMLREILAKRFVRTGQFEKAMPLYDQVIDARVQIDGADHPRVAQARGNYGVELFRAGKRNEAKQQWIAAWRVVSSRTDLSPLARAEIAALLATVSTDQDNPTASELFETALGAMRSADKPRPIYANTLLNYWLVQFDAGDHAKALQLAQELQNIAPRVYAPNGYELSQARLVLVRSMLKTDGDLALAEPIAREVVRIRESLKPPNPLGLANARSILGEVLLRLARIDEAAPLIEETAQFFESRKDAPEKVVKEAQDRLADLRKAQSR